VDELVQGLKKCAKKKALVVLLKAEANKHNVWSAGHDINELPEGRRDPLDYFDAVEVLLRECRFTLDRLLPWSRGASGGHPITHKSLCEVGCPLGQ
jgi:hypothetical protein